MSINRWKPRIGENLACVQESTILKTAMLWLPVVKNQDHVDSIENDRLLWIRQHAFLRSAQMLEVMYFSRHCSATGEGMYGIIIFGLVQFS